MPSLFRIIEVIVYSLLNFLPFLVLALYPFRHSLRFSKGVTGLLIGLLTIIQVLKGFFFPTLAMQDYRWSFSLMLFAVEICLSVPVLLYMELIYTPAIQNEPSGFE